MFKTVLKKLAKRTVLLAGMAFLCVAIIAPEVFTAFAVSPATTPAETDFANGIEAVQGVLNVVLWPILMIIGALLDNTLLFGSGMEERIREIWIPIRNLVNIFFVLVLVGVALYNVLGLGEKDGQASLKALLPKIVVGLILVNFSFFAMKVVLDATNLLTTAIFAIPAEITGEVQINDKEEKSLCDKDFSTYETLCTGGKLNEQGKQFLNKWGSHNAAMLLAIKTGKVIFYKDVDVKMENWEQLSISVIVSMIMYLLFGVAFLALLAILAIRIVVLWVVIVLSPILILAMASPELSQKIPPLKDLIDKFIAILMAPITIALTLSVGWIMLSAFQGYQSLEGSSLTIGKFAGENMASGIPVAGLSTIQSLIVAIGTIAVIWAGVFGAAKGTYAEAAVAVLGEAVKGAAKWAAWTPIKHLPIAPGMNIGDFMGKIKTFTGTTAAAAAAKTASDKLKRDDPLLSDSEIMAALKDPNHEIFKHEKYEKMFRNSEMGNTQTYRGARGKAIATAMNTKRGTGKVAMQTAAAKAAGLSTQTQPLLPKKAAELKSPTQGQVQADNEEEAEGTDASKLTGQKAVAHYAEESNGDNGTDAFRGDVTTLTNKPDKTAAQAILTKLRADMGDERAGALGLPDMRTGLREGLGSDAENVYGNMVESFRENGDSNNTAAENRMLKLIKGE